MMIDVEMKRYLRIWRNKDEGFVIDKTIALFGPLTAKQKAAMVQQRKGMTKASLIRDFLYWRLKKEVAG